MGSAARKETLDSGGGDESPPGPAVLVKNASLEFGSGTNRVVALDRLDLTVPAGVIYALLGPSGCGKTCLLSCIIHKRTLHKGSVEVFGYRHGQQGAGVPGPWVGYMPQDLHLYPELSVTETMTYFGHLNGLSSETLAERVTSSRELLDLVDHSRLVSGLSGGQQRRLSLVVAMLHEPPLLVLDEPTVGLDPILRALLLEHLSRMVQHLGTTVLLTTHYVEEARQAHLVGLMRNGRILIEKDPEVLMMELGVNNMEDAFLRLCMKDEAQSKEREDTSHALGHANPAYVCCGGEQRNCRCSAGLDTHQANTSNFNPSKPVAKKRVLSDKVQCQRLTRPPKCVEATVQRHISQVATVVSKNLHRLKRNMLFLFAVVLLPVVVLVMIRVLLGHDPVDLPLAVVNEERPSILSHYLLKMLPEEDLVLKEFPSVQKAIDSVRSGSAVGLLHISQNFTRNIRKRLQEGVNASETVVRNSQVSLRMGTGNSVLVAATYEAVAKAFRTMANHFAIALGLNPGAMYLSLQMEVAVPGLEAIPYSEVLCAGWICGVIYVIGLGASCLTFVQEMESGMLDRSLAAGLTFGQLVASQLLMQSAVSLVHVSSAVLFLWASGMAVRGSLFLASSILVLQNGLGVAHGILLSWVTGSTLSSLVILTAVQAIDYCVSGLAWPVEGLPHWAQEAVFYLSPVSVGAQALKMVLFRGLTLGHSLVRFSFLLNAARITVTFIVLYVTIRIRK